MNLKNERINRAINFATEKHGEQKRLGIPFPYIFHPIDVAKKIYLYSKLCEEDLMIAAIDGILHDTIEDTPTKGSEIREVFGETVQLDVEALTLDASHKGSKKSKMWENLGRIKDRPSRVACVKMADRASNLDIFPGFWTRDKIERYLDESDMILDTLNYASKGLSACLSNKIQECRLMLSISKRG